MIAEDSSNLKSDLKGWPKEIEAINYTSSIDQSQQPTLIYVAKDKEAKRPLLVALHTWSYSYESAGAEAVYARWCIANDWHFVHLYNPRDVVPLSMMPGYPWYFNEDKSPKPEAIALVAYLQWLGSWLDDRGTSLYDARP